MDCATDHKQGTPTAGPYFFEPIPADAYTDPDIGIRKDSLFWVIDSKVAGEVLATVDKVAGGVEQAQANARLFAAAWELLRSLKELLGDIDNGLLVRDITRDGDPGWSMHMLDFVQRLQRAQAAVQKAEGH